MVTETGVGATSRGGTAKKVREARVTETARLKIVVAAEMAEVAGSAKEKAKAKIMMMGI